MLIRFCYFSGVDVTRWPFICEEHLAFVFLWLYVRYCICNHVLFRTLVLIVKWDDDRRPDVWCVNHRRPHIMGLGCLTLSRNKSTFNCRFRRIHFSVWANVHSACERVWVFAEFPPPNQIVYLKIKKLCKMQRMLMFGHWSSARSLARWLSQWFHTCSKNSKTMTWWQSHEKRNWFVYSMAENEKKCNLRSECHAKREPVIRISLSIYCQIKLLICRVWVTMGDQFNRILVKIEPFVCSINSSCADHPW